MLMVLGPHWQKPWFSQPPSVGVGFISVPFELLVAVGCYRLEEVAWLGERCWESHHFWAVFEGEITAFDLWVVAKPFMEISREASSLVGESSVWRCPRVRSPISSWLNKLLMIWITWCSSVSTFGYLIATSPMSNFIYRDNTGSLDSNIRLSTSLPFFSEYNLCSSESFNYLEINPQNIFSFFFQFHSPHLLESFTQ